MEGRPQARVVREEHGGRRLVNMPVGLLLTLLLFFFEAVLLVLEARVVLRVHGALDRSYFGGAEFLGLAHGCDFSTHGGWRRLQLSASGKWQQQQLQHQ